MSTRNRIILELRAAERRAPTFAGCDRWALDVAALRRPAAEHTRILAWAHLLERRGQRMRQTVVQREARERALHRAPATLLHPHRHSSGPHTGPVGGGAA